MTTSAATYTCLHCGRPKAYDEMRQRYDKVGGVKAICIECDRKRGRAYFHRRKEASFEGRRGGQSSKIDPCPRCGVSQAEHWRCRICTARGHILPRSTVDPTICADCEQNIINGRLSTAA